MVGTKGTVVFLGVGGFLSFYSLYSNQVTLICPLLLESETYTCIYILNSFIL